VGDGFCRPAGDASRLVVSADRAPVPSRLRRSEGGLIAADGKDRQRAVAGRSAPRSYTGEPKLHLCS